MKYLHDTETPLIGMSDASLKHDQCTHAWFLSTGNPDHITDCNMSIHGTGAVDGAPSSMSSTEGSYMARLRWQSY